MYLRKADEQEPETTFYTPFFNVSNLLTVLKMYLTFRPSILQGQSDRSVTAGFREGLSTLDIRHSTDEDLESRHIRGVYVRRPGSRTSNTSTEENTTPTGPYGHKHFRMIDASACDLRDPIGSYINTRSNTIFMTSVAKLCNFSFRFLSSFSELPHQWYLKFPIISN